MNSGCNIGLDVIPFNGATFQGEPIHIVTWSGDKQCGIYRNQFNFTGKQCLGNGNFGNVVEYTHADINCSIDTFTPILAVAMVLVTFRKRLKIKLL